MIADSWSSTTEEILSASPDLVLASVPYRLESLAAILKCGVPVLTLAPHSLADIYQDIRLLGSILHVPDRAEGGDRRDALRGGGHGARCPNRGGTAGLL